MHYSLFTLNRSTVLNTKSISQKSFMKHYSLNMGIQSAIKVKIMPPTHLKMKPPGKVNYRMARVGPSLFHIIQDK